MTVVDTFMVNAETDMLTLRLDTMADAVDWFVAVEADVDHQNHPKSFHISEALERGEFAEWKDKLVVVQATGLPDFEHESDPWCREWAQRDWCWVGLDQIEARTGEPLSNDTVILHGDIDEVCNPMHVRNVRPRFKEFVLFAQTMYSFAVDWEHPDPWGGTVAFTLATLRAIRRRTVIDGEVYHPGPWQICRNQRNGLMARNFDYEGTGWSATVLPYAGWHFSWLGGQDAAMRKLGSFCHPEVADRIEQGLSTDLYLREGFHVDGRKMRPVDVDETFPRWIREGHAPAEWFRPR